jgi:mannosyl-3-phosphoglycerate phosphatase
VTPKRPVVLFTDVQLPGGSRANGHVREMLERNGIVLVLYSSRTRAELEVCRQALGIANVFIAESGAAVFVPHDCLPFPIAHGRNLTGYRVVEFGRPYADVTDALHRTAARLSIEVVGFSDMSIGEVALECRLSLLEARLAKLREYDEPFRIVGSDSGSQAHDRLFKALQPARLTCTHHGRFDHLGGAVTKAMSVELVTALYRQALGPIVTVGLGHSRNEAALLHHVDVPVIVAPADATVSPRRPPDVPGARLGAVGITDWLETVIDIARRARTNPPHPDPRGRPAA